MKNLLLLLALATTAGAVPITGSIGFTGPYVSNNSDLTLATSITFATSGPNQPVTAGVSTGSFASILAGTPVTMSTPLAVNPQIVPVGAMWSIAGFTLTLGTFVEQFNTPQSLVLYGTGILSNGIAADNALGDLIMTLNQSGANFTYSASSSAKTPDGGATVLLLGASMIGLLCAKINFRK